MIALEGDHIGPEVVGAGLDILVAAADLHRYFDVILADNLFGDLISDAVGTIAGSLGMLGSASLPRAEDPGTRIPGGIYEPRHGTAPDISGRGIANPFGAILSVAMLIQHAAARPDIAAEIEGAVERVLDASVFSPDLGGTASTEDATAAIIAALQR